MVEWCKVGSMKTIHKYAIEPGHREKVMLPSDARVITVGSELVGTIHFWVELDISVEELNERTFVLWGTGAAIPDHHYYVGSAFTQKVEWHLYQSIPEAEDIFESAATGPPDSEEE